MVYLLHFSQPYRHARHYIGYAATPATFERRIAHHRAGTGARLPKVVADTGGTFEVAEIWPDGDRKLERLLKNRHGAGRFCPICKRLHKIKNDSLHKTIRRAGDTRRPKTNKNRENIETT